MSETSTLALSIGDGIPASRLGGDAWSGQVQLLGKPLQVRISAAAMRAVEDAASPVLAGLELYFSCLVRKQVRFSALDGNERRPRAPAAVVPGLYLDFRAVTTRHCSIADTDGGPPVDTMPVKQPGRFVPDWLNIDYRAGRWLGEYGFTTRR